MELTEEPPAVPEAEKGPRRAGVGEDHENDAIGESCAFASGLTSGSSNACVCGVCKKSELSCSSAVSPETSRPAPSLLARGERGVVGMTRTSSSSLAVLMSVLLAFDFMFPAVRSQEEEAPCAA